MLTPTHCRMARAALHLTLAEVGAVIGVSKEALSQFEHGNTSVISPLTRNRLELFYREQGLHFTGAGNVSWRRGAAVAA